MLLSRAKERLEEGSYTCVLTDGTMFLTSTSRGVKPLVEFLQHNTPEGLYAADKVVGRATAFLYVLLKIEALYAKVISKPAISVLETYGIEVHYELAVDHVINRRGDGICPFEEAVLDIKDPKEAYAAILKKMRDTTSANESSKGELKI